MKRIKRLFAVLCAGVVGYAASAYFHDRQSTKPMPPIQNTHGVPRPAQYNEPAGTDWNGTMVQVDSYDIIVIPDTQEWHMFRKIVLICVVVLVVVGLVRSQELEAQLDDKATVYVAGTLDIANDERGVTRYFLKCRGKRIAIIMVNGDERDRTKWQNGPKPNDPDHLVHWHERRVIIAGTLEPVFIGHGDFNLSIRATAISGSHQILIKF